MRVFASDSFARRWKTMTLAEQLGNVGSEVERVFTWRRKGREELAAGAFDRSLDLIDLTLSDPRWRGAKRKELARMREFLCEMVLGENSYGMTEEFFTQYFLAFARAGRLSRYYPCN
jgi:hypothetical protein